MSARPRLHLMTASRLKTLNACPRQHEYRYERGYVPLVDADALRFGTLIHLGLEAWWKAHAAGSEPGPDRTALDVALDTVSEHIAAQQRGETDEFEAARCMALLAGYDARWSAFAAGCEVIGVEVPFLLPMLHPRTGEPAREWRIAGKMDGVLRLADGRVAVLEHKCLAGDARIFDHATGTYERVDALYARGASLTVTAVDEAERLHVVRGVRITPAAVRPIYRVSTLGGRSLRVSGNHPILTQRGWVNAEGITLDDWAATPRHMACARADAPLSDEAIRLIGYMIGDGCLQGMAFTKSDAAVMADVLRCGASLGEMAVPKYPAKKPPYVKFSVSTHGPVRRLMELAGMTLATHSADKRLPLHLALSDRQLGQLVGALWNTDGCIDSFNGKKIRVIYTSVSRELCTDIQHALQRLGVVSGVRTTSVCYKGERRPVSTVQVVSREGKRRFLSLALEGVIPVLRSRVPVAAALAMIPTAAQGADWQHQPRTLDVSERIWWDRIESVEVQAAEQTYDIEVPGVHTFVVDGIVTHNTSGEETGVGSDYRRRLMLDPQVSQYFEGVRTMTDPQTGEHIVADVCLYDVLQKPAIKPRTATPEADRIYTQPKSRACRECGKKTAPPPPHTDPETGTTCVDGRITTDTGGRLRAGQREHDETPGEYAARVNADIAADLDGYFQHIEVIRLPHEQTTHGFNVWHAARQIWLMRHDGYHRQNPSACVRYGRCAYIDVCEGTARIDDPGRFRRIADPHVELADALGALQHQQTEQTNDRGENR